MAGFDNDVLFCDNVTFDSTSSRPHNGIITQDGQLLIGSAVSNPTNAIKAGELTSDKLTISYSDPDLVIDTISGNNINTSINVDVVAGGIGTTLVTPDASGNIDFFGAAHAQGFYGLAANPLVSVKNGTSTASFSIQYAGTGAGPFTPGIASFNASHFTLANAYVSLNTSHVGQTITGDSGGALNPTGGNWNIIGAGGITTSGSGSTLTIDGSSIGAGTITGDSGGALSQTAGNWNLLGSGSIATSGVGSTLTTQLTGLTNHALLVGAGTSTITKIASGSTGQVLQTNTGADPSWSTATYPSTATSTGTLLRADGTNWVATTSTYPSTNAVSTLLYASSANVMSALATANSGLLVTSNTGVPSILAGPGTTGNILQSNAAAAPSFSTATYPSVSSAAGKILYDNGTNFVLSTPTFPASASATSRKIIVSDGTNWVASTETYAVPGTSGNVLTSDGTNWTSAAPTGGGMTWTEVTGTSQSAAVNNGYIANNAGLVTITLPGTFAVGDIVAVVGKGAGLWVLDAPAGDTIHYGNQSTSSGGTITATHRYDAIEVIGITANAEWAVRGISQGNLTVA